MAGRRPLANVWVLACRTCGAQAGEPCIDLRAGPSRVLYGRRTHPERARDTKEARKVASYGTPITRTPTTWTQWVSGSTTTTGDYIWTQWVGNTTTTTTISCAQLTAWEQWRVADYVDRRNHGWLTEEEQAELQDRLQRQREERSRRRLAEQVRMEGARERARELLDLVVAEQDRVPGLELLAFTGSDGFLYRIEMHSGSVHGNIVRTDEHGCVLGRACVAPRMVASDLALPLEDGWLGQYLGLKYDAEEFLSHANWSNTMQGCREPAPQRIVPIAA